MPGIAGETIPRGAAVYMSAVDGRWYLADSDAVATLPAVGIVSDAGAAGNVIQILVLGMIERSDWTWTRGDTLYISGTAGVMTQVAPANAQPVAVALTATLIYVNTTLSTVGAAAGISSGISYFSTNATVAAGATRYWINASNSANETVRQIPVTRATTLSDLSINLSAAPVGAETATITLRLNGAPTALTVTITGAATQGQDNVNTVAVAKDDLISFEQVMSGGAVASVGSCSVRYT